MKIKCAIGATIGAPLVVAAIIGLFAGVDYLMSLNKYVYLVAVLLSGLFVFGFTWIVLYGICSGHHDHKKEEPLSSMTNSNKVIVEPRVGKNSKTFNLDYEPSDKLVEYLERLTGVTNVFRENKYALTIYIGKVFSWNDLEPKIIQALQNSAP